MKRAAWVLLLLPPLGWSLPWLDGDVLVNADLGGALIPDKVWAGEWWRVLTSPLLHVQPRHLLVNLAGLALFGHLATTVFGLGRAALTAMAGAYLGTLASLMWVDGWALGASGAVFALLGATVVGGLRLRPPPHPAVPWLLAAASITLALSGPTNRVAHIAGLAAGALCGRLLRPTPPT